MIVGISDASAPALDAEPGQTVLKILRQAALAPSRAVIVVTHDSRIFYLADRIIAMEDGRIRSIRSQPFGALSEVA